MATFRTVDTINNKKFLAVTGGSAFQVKLVADVNAMSQADRNKFFTEVRRQMIRQAKG